MEFTPTQKMGVDTSQMRISRLQVWGRIAALFLIFFMCFASTLGAQGQSLTALPLTVTPASLNFGGTAVGTETPPQSVNLTNVASYQFPVKIAVTGPFLITSDTCGDLLSGGASCQVSLVFSPVTPGNFSGTLSIFPAVPSPTVSLRGSAPIPGAVSYSWTVNVSDLPDVQPLPPGTPAAPADVESLISTADASVGGAAVGALAAPSASANTNTSEGDPPTLQVNPTFQGLDYGDQGSNAIPPDTQIGASPNYVLEAVNHAFEVFDKAGNKVSGPKSLYDLFGIPATTNLCDPIVRYDPASGRWFISAMTWTNADSGGNILLAVSDTSDPTGSYHGLSEEVPYLPDFPHMAIGDDKVVVSAEGYVLQNGSVEEQETEFWVFNKSQVIATDPFIDTEYYPPDQGGYHIIPAQPFSTSSTLYMASVPTGGIVDHLYVWSLSGTPGVGAGTSMTLKLVPIDAPLLPSSMAAQEGTKNLVNTSPQGLLDAYFRNGTLWASANAQCKGSANDTACVWFVQIDTSTMAETKEFDFGGPGNYFYFPAIRPDSSGDMLAVFSGSSAEEYPSVYAGVSLSPNFDGLQFTTLIHAGDQAWSYAGKDDRWGDYSGAAPDPMTGMIWVAGEYATSDLSSASIWGTWISQVTPEVASHVYVANSGSNSVSVINTATNTVTATIPAVNKPGAGPSGIAVTPDRSRVYVPSYFGSDADPGSQGLVSVINTASDSVEATIPVGFYTDGIVITPDGTRAYVSNECASSTCSLGSSGSVSMIDTATNTVDTTIPVGSAPFGIAVTPDGTRVYVANECGSPGTCSSGSVSVISTASNTVTATIPLSLKPFGIAITPDGTRAYLTDFGAASVSVINTATNTVVATIPVGNRPTGVAITPDGTRVYVANLGSNSVYVINTATNTVVAIIPVGSSPVGVGITADGTRVYVADLGSGSVSVINTANNTVMDTVPVGASPQGVAARSLP